MDKQIRGLTVSEINKLEGFLENKENIDENSSSLEIWYNNIQNKKLLQLTDGNIARLIRQEFHLRYAIHEGIHRLWDNPVAGDLFDGEILVMICRLEKQFWLINLDLKEKIEELVWAFSNERFSFPSDFEWITEDDEKEFYNSLDLLKSKIT